MDSTMKLNRHSYFSLHQRISCDEESPSDKRMPFQHVNGGSGSRGESSRYFYFLPYIDTSPYRVNLYNEHIFLTLSEGK